MSRKIIEDLDLFVAYWNSKLHQVVTTEKVVSSCHMSRTTVNRVLNRLPEDCRNVDKDLKVHHYIPLREITLAEAIDANKIGNRPGLLFDTPKGGGLEALHRKIDALTESTAAISIAMTELIKKTLQVIEHAPQKD